MQREHDNLEAEIGCLNYTTLHDAKEIDSLHKKISDSESTISELKVSLVATEDRLKRLEKRQRKFLLAIEEAVASYRQKYVDLAETTDAKDLEIEDLKAERDGLRLSSQNYQRQLEDLMNRMSADQDTLLEQAATIIGFQDSLKLRDVHEEKMITEHQNEIEELEGKLKAALDLLEETRDERDQAIEDLKTHQESSARTTTSVMKVVEENEVDGSIKLLEYLEREKSVYQELLEAIAERDAKIQSLTADLERSGDQHRAHMFELLNQQAAAFLEVRKQRKEQEVEINNFVWNRHEAIAAELEKKLRDLKDTVRAKDAEIEGLKAELDSLSRGKTEQQLLTTAEKSSEEDQKDKQISHLLECFSKDKETITMLKMRITELEQTGHTMLLEKEIRDLRHEMENQLSNFAVARKRLETELVSVTKQMNKEANARSELSLKNYHLEQAAEFERINKTENEQVLTEMQEKNQKLMVLIKRMEEGDDLEKEELKKKVQKYKNIAYDYKMRCEKLNRPVLQEQFNGTWKCVSANKPEDLELPKSYESWTVGNLILKLKGDTFKKSVVIGGVEKVDMDVKLVEKAESNLIQSTWLEKQRLITMDPVHFPLNFSGYRSALFRIERYIEHDFLKINILCDEGVATFTFKKTSQFVVPI